MSLYVSDSGRVPLLWVEEYRPKKIEDCALTEAVKSALIGFRNSGEIPNMILSGTAGTGKTTAAKALAYELDADVLVVNGSDEGRSIDVVRTTMAQFASSVSISGGRKVILIDEADYMNQESVAPALRNFIEKFANNVSFVFTCNYKNRIIEPIQSRCTTLDFTIPKKERPQIASQMMARLKMILVEKQVEYEEKVVAELLMKHFPDFRRTINELQRYSKTGPITTGILSGVGDANISELVGYLKTKSFKEMRKWVAMNSDGDPSTLYRLLYDKSQDYFAPESIPQLVLILADYSYKSAFVSDHELNLVACFTEIMSECRLK